jgi:hypothetical protein
MRDSQDPGQAANPDVSQTQSQSSGVLTKEERRAAILHACRTPKTAGELRAQLRIPRPTLFRDLKDLVAQGRLRHAGETYAATQPDSQELAPLERDWLKKPLELLWPFLTCVAIAIFRAFVELFAYAVIARRYDAGGDNFHPGFVTYGDTGSLKTTHGTACCIIAGADPEKVCVAAMGFRGHGLIGRLGPSGKLGSIQELFGEPAFLLEEAALADPQVKLGIKQILHGGKRITLENQIIEVKAVPILEFNPKKGTRGLEEALPLEPQSLRRSILLQTPRHHELTNEMRAESQQALARIKELGPAFMPPPPPTPLSEKHAQIVVRALSDCIKNECARYVDIGVARTLIFGARAVREDAEAVQRVLHALLTVASTNEFTTPRWEERLAEILNPPVVKPTVVNGAACSVTPSEPKPQLPKEAVMPTNNPYSLDQNLTSLKVDIEAAGYRWPDDQVLIRGFLKVIRELTARDYNSKSFLMSVEFWQRVIEVVDLLGRMNISAARLESAVALDSKLAARRMSYRQFDGVLEYCDELPSLGFSLYTARHLAEQLNAARVQCPVGKTAVEHLLDSAMNYTQMVEDYAYYEQRRDELKAESAKAAAELSECEKMLGEKRGELKDLEERIKKAKAELQTNGSAP